MNNLLARLICAALATTLLATVTAGPTSADTDSPASDLDSVAAAAYAGDYTSSVTRTDGQIISTFKDQATGEIANGSSISGSSLGESYKTAPQGGGTASADQLSSIAAYTTWKPTGIQGIDVSSNESTVNWSEDYNAGARFAYVKATESVVYKSPTFAAQYKGAYDSGTLRGAYHFALPDDSSGAAQADYFINNGGGWSPDGRTLPGMIDLEATAGQDYCYKMTPAQMVSWIRDFSNRYKARTGRLPAMFRGGVQAGVPRRAAAGGRLGPAHVGPLHRQALPEADLLG